MPLWIGLAQCVSLIPGMSRSGSTIVGGLLAGLDRRFATEYSFFLALPTMIIATIYQMLKSQAAFSRMITSRSGLAWWFRRCRLGRHRRLSTFVQRHSLSVFAYYRMALGIVVLFVVR